MGVVRYTFYSEILREQTYIHAVVPSYEPWRNTEGCTEFYNNYQKRKVLYVLHGGSDDSSLYLRRTRIEEYAGDMVVIFPEVRNSFYCDMVHGKKYFTYLTKELPKIVENVFMVSDKREDHFVLGNSMGSHGAFKWALNCPDYFAAAVGMSGAGDLEELGFYDRMPDRVINSFGTLEEYRGSYNDFKYLYNKLLADNTNLADLPRFYACCGTEDGFYAGAKKFAEDAAAKGFPITWEEGPGGHTWEFWDAWLPVMINHMLEEE